MINHDKGSCTTGTAVRLPRSPVSRVSGKETGLLLSPPLRTGLAPFNRLPPRRGSSGCPLGANALVKGRDDAIIVIFTILAGSDLACAYGCTSVCCHSYRVPLGWPSHMKSLALGSRDETPDGSLLSFERGDVVCTQPLSISLQNGFCFLHLPLPAVL